MQANVFQSQALPEPLAATVRARLEAAHAAAPFTPVDPRSTVRRVVDALADLPLDLTVYRGGVDLRGSEVDHVWLAVSAATGRYVVDAAFPLFVDAFVDTLRRFVAGDASTSDLAATAATTGVDDRILGLFPRPIAYRGAPIWAERS
jgi:hypothetical protein